MELSPQVFREAWVRCIARATRSSGATLRLAVADASPETGAGIPVYTPVVRSHAWVDQRSLALHEAVAAKLEADPQLLRVARANVDRWLRANPTAALVEWRRLLDAAPLPRLLALLRSPGDDAARLRQSSPFAGLLTPRERQSILDRYESRRA